MFPFFCANLIINNQIHFIPSLSIFQNNFYKFFLNFSNINLIYTIRVTIIIKIDYRFEPFDIITYKSTICIHITKSALMHPLLSQESKGSKILLQNKSDNYYKPHLNSFEFINCLPYLLIYLNYSIKIHLHALLF